MSSTVWPALVSLVVALATSWLTTLRQRERLREELDNALVIQKQRLETELRTEFMAEEALKQLLNHPRFENQRTFDAIKQRIGGFDDNEHRRLLVRAGAVKFTRKRDGAEMWGLRDRNERESYDAKLG